MKFLDPSLSDGRVGCFPTLAIVTSAVMNSGALIYLQYLEFN